MAEQKTALIVVDYRRAENRARKLNGITGHVQLQEVPSEHAERFAELVKKRALIEAELARLSELQKGSAESRVPIKSGKKFPHGTILTHEHVRRGL